MPTAGEVVIDSRPYFLIQEKGAYKVAEVPSHFDIDPRMERRVIYSDFSMGIRRRREQKSSDTPTSSPYNTQNAAGPGIWWGNGCDTRLSDRVLAQRATTASNFSSTQAPLKIGDLIGSANSYGWMVTTATNAGNVYYHTGGAPGTWTLSKSRQTWTDLGYQPTDAITFNGKLYVAVQAAGVAQSYWTWDATSATTVWSNGNAYTENGQNAASGQAIITFSSAPSGFTNGQQVVVDTGANVETLTISSGAGSASWTMTTNLTHTHTAPYGIQGLAGASANPTASYFVTIRNQLWRASGANIYSTVDGSVWSGATAVGDPNQNITGIDVYEDFLYIYKPDGIYTADRAGQVYPVYPGFRELGVNVRPMGQWRGSYYFAADTGMIWQVTRDQVDRIGFDLAEPYPMNGNNMSIPNVTTYSKSLSLPNFLITPVDQFSGATTGAYFLAWDGNGWHPFIYYPNATAGCIGLTQTFTTPSNPTIHFSYKSGSNYVVTYMSNPLIDPFLAASFDTSAQVFYLPVDNGALEDEDKVLERVSVMVDQAGTGTIRVAYATDDKIATLVFTDLGAPVSGDLQFFQTFTPTSPLPKYKKIALQVTLTPSATSGSPMIRNIVLHYKQRGPQRRTWDLMILAEESLIGQSGRVESRTAKKMVADLNAIRTSRSPVKFQDLLGNNTYVYVDEVGEETVIIRSQNRTQSVSFIVPVKLVEATTT